MPTEHEHDWIVIVPDPYGHPERGVQQCTHCLVEVACIHPVFIEPDVEPLASSPFGPIAAGLVRPARRRDLTPTFQEPQ